MTDTAAIRARHVPRWEGDIDRTTPAGDTVMRQVCNWEDCENDWPCDTALVLAALDVERKVADNNLAAYDAAIEREARLRAALTEAIEKIDGEWNGHSEDWDAALATTPEGE